MANIRLMIPSRRNDLPEWEISHGDTVIGWIRKWHSGRGSSMFYEATVLHPVTSTNVCLESDSQFDRQVDAILEFRRDPESGRVHDRSHFGQQLARVETTEEPPIEDSLVGSSHQTIRRTRPSSATSSNI